MALIHWYMTFLRTTFGMFDAFNILTVIATGICSIPYLQLLSIKDGGRWALDAHIVSINGHLVPIEYRRFAHPLVQVRADVQLHEFALEAV